MRNLMGAQVSFSDSRRMHSISNHICNWDDPRINIHKVIMLDSISLEATRRNMQLVAKAAWKSSTSWRDCQWPTIDSGD